MIVVVDVIVPVVSIEIDILASFLWMWSAL